MRENVWRAEEIALLQRHYASGGDSHVAARLGRTRDSVTGVARRLGLTCPLRHRRQAASRARNNRSVDVNFFDGPNARTRYVLDFIRRRGKVRTAPRFVLRLCVPRNEEDDLNTVRDLLRSNHRVQRRGNSLTLEVCSRALVETLLSRHGPA